MTRSLISALAFAALPLAAVTAAAQTASSSVELTSLDRTADACVDFYQFACGGWIAANPLPADRRTFGRTQELQDRNFAVLRRLLETPGAGADRKQASNFYAACMNETAIDARGLAPLTADLARIAALRRAELPAQLAHLQDVATIMPGPGQWMSTPLFGLGALADSQDATREMAQLSAGGIALPDRDIYLNTDARTVALRDAYRDHVRQVLMLLGDTPEAAAGGARAVLAVETTLASAALTAVARRDPQQQIHPMSLAELRALTPGFDWPAYFTAVGAPPFTVINVRQPAYMQAVNTLVATAPLADLQAYLRWHLAHASAVMLPAAFRQADFDFFGRALRGQQAPLPRWRECVSATDERLGDALGKAFVDETFPPRAKADTLAMATAIKAAMAREIRDAAWMSDATKQAARLKLDAVVDRIGYPERWRDYGAVHIATDDAAGNLQRAVTFEQHREYQLIGQTVDRAAWVISPPTVNAYYSAQLNSINFPAGILQPPYYDAGRDAAVNYGAAGSVIGHELTHGFDDQGRAFDGDGNKRDWWTAADAQAFDGRAACIADQYSQYVATDEVHINGKLTLGENTADAGGLRLALMAYLAGTGAHAGPLDGFTPPQRVFLGFAQLYCENSRPEAERLKAATNPHSSNRYRVNGPVSNMPEFREAFSCPAGAPMVRPNACRVW